MKFGNKLTRNLFILAGILYIISALIGGNYTFIVLGIVFGSEKKKDVETEEAEENEEL